VQVRVAFVDFEPADVIVAGKHGADAPPYRRLGIDSRRAPGGEARGVRRELLEVLARIYRVDEASCAC